MTLQVGYMEVAAFCKVMEDARAGEEKAYLDAHRYTGILSAYLLCPLS